MPIRDWPILVLNVNGMIHITDKTTQIDMEVHNFNKRNTMFDKPLLNTTVALYHYCK